MRLVGLAVALVVTSSGCGRFAFDPLTIDDGGRVGDGLRGDGGGRSDWWDAQWQHRIKLSIAPTENYDRFPLLVVLDTSRINFADLQAAGQDVRFVDADDTTVLPHEIETWNVSGRSALWVRVPNLAPTGDDFLWLYYGNPTAVAAPDPATLWADYVGVWHLAENPTAAAPQFRDSSPGANAGTSAGGMAANQQIAGLIGGALQLDGIDDWITAPGTPSLQIGGDLTVTVWAMSATVGTPYWFLDFVFPMSETEAHNHLYELALDVNSRIQLHWEYGAGNDENLDSGASIATGTNTWMMISVTRSLSLKQVRFFENDIALGTVQSFVNDPTGGDTASLWLGGENDTSTTKQPINGRLDEIRIAPTAQSPGFISTQYRSMTDALLTYGVPETY